MKLSFGSVHDGEGAGSTCALSDNHIMVPVPQNTNFANLFTFSACSIAQFKTYLLVNNGLIYKQI